MIAREQNIGDLASFPFMRAGIVRVLEKPRLKALLGA
jgi:hypothetical protein